MDILETFGTDKSLEENGVWVKLDDETSLLIARIGNKNFTKESKKLVSKIKQENPFKQKFDHDDLNEDQSVEIIAKTILLGWKGLKFGGKVLEYNFENAKKVLSIKDFLEKVLWIAREMETFKKQTLEEEKETLGKS